MRGSDVFTRFHGKLLWFYIFFNKLFLTFVWESVAGDHFFSEQGTLDRYYFGNNFKFELLLEVHDEF